MLTRYGKRWSFPRWWKGVFPILCCRTLVGRLALFMAFMMKGVEVKRKINILIILLASFLLSGCAAQINKVMSSWMYHHYSELIGSWGPPQYVYGDGRGGRILTYTSPRSFVVPGSSYTAIDATIYDNYIWGTAVTIYNPTRVYGWTAYRMFWIDKRGYIYRWSWRGL